MPELVLFGHKESGHAYKVALALAMTGAPHLRRIVDIWAPPTTRPQDFLRASPFAEVPLLLIGNRAMVQSASILLELAGLYPALWGGKRATNEARCREILFWEANRIGMCLPQLIEARRVDGAGFPPGAIDWLHMRYAADRDRFDRLLGENAFFMGDTPSIADCAVIGYTQWHEKAGVEPSASMAGWLARMRALPAHSPAEALFPS